MRDLAKATALVLAFASSASGLEPDRAISQYAHRAWRMENGLPNSVVRGILQTSDGYIWVATYEGLARFNGDSFTRFDKNNLPALQRDTVLAFMKSRDGTLWVGTNGGGVGSLRDGAIRVLTVKDGLPSDIVAALAEDRDGAMWIGTSAGLCVLRGGRIERPDLPEVSILSMAVQADGTLWIGTRGRGVLAVRNGRVQSVPALASLEKTSVYSLLLDRDGTVWTGTNQGLYRFPKEGLLERIEGSGIL